MHPIQIQQKLLEISEFSIFVFIIIINTQALITYKIYFKSVDLKMVVSKVNQTQGKALYFSSVFVKSFNLYGKKNFTN